MWLKDPITRVPSVALTLLVIATFFMVAGTIMEAFTTLRSSHLLDELFGAAVSLYGGHMFAFRDCIDRQGPPPEMPPRSNITP